MSYTQVLRDTGTNLTVTFYADAVAVDADGVVTVTITKTDGTALATDAATTHGSTGQYSFALADQADLDYLTVVWTGVFGGLTQTQTDYVEIVGAYYFTLAELKAQPNMGAKTAAQLSTARRWFETTFESFTGSSWIPRYKRIRADGTGSNVLVLPDTPIRSLRKVRVYSNTTTYTDYTADELADIDLNYGIATRRTLGVWARGTTNTVVDYEYGHDYPPEDIKQAGLVAARVFLMGDNVGDRVYSIQTDVGIAFQSTPGKNRPFGIPFADEVANRHAGQNVAIA